MSLALGCSLPQPKERRLAFPIFELQARLRECFYHPHDDCVGVDRGASDRGERRMSYLGPFNSPGIIEAQNRDILREL